MFLVPALVLYFGVGITEAAGAGLLAVIATSCTAASFNLKLGTANIRLGLVLNTTTVLGAITGGVAAAYVPERTLIGAFGALLIVISWLLWRDKNDGETRRTSAGALGGEYHDPAVGRTISYSPKRLPAGLAAGFASGNLSGLLGVGGGVLNVPVMHLYCELPMKAATATSNFMIGVTAAASAAVYFGRGDIDPRMGGAVVLGAVAGSRLGAHLGARFKDQSLRRAFTLLTLFLSVQMLWRAFHGG